MPEPDYGRSVTPNLLSKLAMIVSNGKVLIVDDHPARAEALEGFLLNNGFQVQIVSDVSGYAQSLGEDSELDVILCELDLEGFSWVDARHSLRAMDVQVPLIMFCDAAEVDKLMTALKLGARDFFLRPVEDKSSLVKSIERCVRHRNLRRDLQESRGRLERANSELRSTVKMLEQDQQAGRQVQLRMLPETPTVLGGYIFSHTVIPSLYLSGDFTDYFTVGKNHAMFFMADVSGHGSSSAFATVLLKNLFARKRSDYMRRDDDAIMNPLDMLHHANKELLDLGLDKFATMVVGLLDMDCNTLRYSIAGHLPLPVLACDEGVRYLEGEGSTVGMMENVEYEEHRLQLPERFTLGIFSDGILEILPPDNLIAKEKHFLEVFEHTAGSPEQLAIRLGLDRVAAAPDDIAALFVTKRG